MLVYEFAVESTVPDNTAFTVLTALRDLGYDALDRVERAEILRLRMRDGAMSIADCGAALKRAEIVFNPNKHRLGYSTSSETPSCEAIVADKDDDTEPLADLLRGRFSIEGLERVERATAWRLFESGAAAPRSLHEWACAQLLANPYSQTYVVRQQPTLVRV